ncbi:MAG: hypothetical protein JXJ17_08780 [Anaerolineae bacterium]|nr:hypothetical protein [Anaerolineae bacterium]
MKANIAQLSTTHRQIDDQHHKTERFGKNQFPQQVTQAKDEGIEDFEDHGNDKQDDHHAHRVFDRIFQHPVGGNL